MAVIKDETLERMIKRILDNQDDINSLNFTMGIVSGKLERLLNPDPPTIGELWKG